MLAQILLLQLRNLHKNIYNFIGLEPIKPVVLTSVLPIKLKTIKTFICIL